MSFLDIDERLLDLIELVEFNKSPIDDIKNFSKECDIGLIEGGCCNTENIHLLKSFRKHCKILVSFGECAIMGGLPALRNDIPVAECLHEAYLSGPSTVNEERILPNDEELPIILNKVYPCHEVVKMDYHLPGCPPRADLIWDVLHALILDVDMELPYEVIKYD
jgi:coenzyme F420-reducing hydrogenase gamma subunit